MMDVFLLFGALILFIGTVYGATRFFSSEISSSGNGSQESAELMSQIKNGLGKVRETGGDVSQRISSSVKEWHDEKKKAAKVEKKFKELRDQPFEEAAQKFIQDEGLPEPVRAEMKQVVNELEDEEKKEKTLIEMVEKVVDEEKMELEELKEVNEIERKVDDELEEVAEDEAEAEKFMAEKREKVREINQQMQSDLQSYREALKQGDEARAQKLQQRIGQEMDRLRGTRDNLKQFLSNFRGSARSLLQDARSRLRGAEEEVTEVENESEAVEEELHKEEDLVNTVEGESRDESEEISEEQEWIENHDTTRDEEEEFSEIKQDITAAAEEANNLDEVVTEEEDEQQNLEEEVTMEEEELETEEAVEKAEEQEFEKIFKEGEDTMETIDRLLEEAERTIDEGRNVEEQEVQEIQGVLQDAREKTEELSTCSPNDSAFPYYYSTVFEKLIDTVEKSASSGEITLAEAEKILLHAEAGTEIVYGGMRTKRVTDLNVAIQNMEEARPVWNGNYSIGRYREIKQDPQSAYNDLKSRIDSIKSNVINSDLRTDDPVREILKRDIVENTRKKSGQKGDLAAAVFVAEGVISAVQEAMQHEELVARMKETVF